jgi:hypothetical protein
MDEHSVEQAPEDRVVVRRRARWSRVLGWGVLALLLVVAAAAVILWTQRRPIANDIIARELEKRGVQATYRLDRVGLRTQQISNLVIGDPRRPDLTARLAQVQMRIRWNGQVEVFRIVARGVRLRGRVADGRVSWGQIDRLLPPPSGKPFRLPDISVDLADATIGLATPFGPLGLAVAGHGNLTGGFRGTLAAASPRLAPGRCELVGMRATVAVAVIARRPQVEGPLSAERFTCPASRLALQRPRLDVAARFSEAFERFQGRGRVAVGSLVAGVNGMAAVGGQLTFAGTPTAARGALDLQARQARLDAILAERTRLRGRYLLNAARGEVTLVADYAARDADLAPSVLAPLTDALTGMRDTPLEPIAAGLRDALQGATRGMDARGTLRLVNFAGGGAVRIERADIRSRSGARIAVRGGDGVTYYWPTGRLRIDGLVGAQGGGLPTVRIALAQPRSGAPMSGVVQMAPYAVNGARLALAPVRFAALANGGTSVNTLALLDGPLPGGSVRGLRVPVSGTLGPGGSLRFGQGCVSAQFQALRLGGLQLGRTSLPICATGQAIVFRQPGGSLAVRAGTRNLALNGTLGRSPFALRAGSAAMTGSRNFVLTALAVRMGNPEAPVLINAQRLNGTFRGRGISGTFSEGDAVIGRVPIRLTEMSGDWRFYRSRLSIAGALTASDMAAEPRFYPLRSTDARFTLADNNIRAAGTLNHPGSGTRVTDVSIRHDLRTGAGQALLDVPSLRFGQALQPEELTRLAQGVVALVQGSISGQGRINWSGEGEVTSTGEFSSNRLDLAAPFGPVTGLKGTIRFSDLLGLETAPGQTVQVATVNPGILVENGVISYQLLPGQLVRVQAGRWPFMGGELILQETVLNLGRPSAKRLTFQVRGLDARQFVESFGFRELVAEGTFDGVLPMIFDENGGRIVGGRLDSRPGGGRLAYDGVVNRANLGTAGNLVFQALRDLRFRSMIIRLDGDLAGEFATRLTIDGVALAGTTRTQRTIRSFVNLPLKFNVSIRGPFRSLIATAKSMRDPRTLISTTIDRPLEDIPGITTEVRRREEDTTQTQTPVQDVVTPEPSRR